MFLGEGTETAAEVSGHLLRSFLVQGRTGTELIPPGQKTATGLAHEEGFAALCTTHQRHPEMNLAQAALMS